MSCGEEEDRCDVVKKMRDAMCCDVMWYNKEGVCVCVM
jgi:hypothetical protein